MIPSFSELESLKELLSLRRLSDKEVAEFMEQPDDQLAVSLAALHIAENSSRFDAAKDEKAWLWLNHNPSYRAFYKNATTRITKENMDGRCYERAGNVEFLTGLYKKRLQNLTALGVDRLQKYQCHLIGAYDPMEIIYARSCVTALSRVYACSSVTSSFETLSSARESIRKSQKCFSEIEDFYSLLDSKSSILAGNSLFDSDERELFVKCRAVRAIKMLSESLDHTARRIDGELAMHREVRKMHGAVRQFLTLFVSDIGTWRCGTPSALVRLAELADATTLISEDTVFRLVKKIREREKAREANWLRKEQKSRMEATPQKSG